VLLGDNPPSPVPPPPPLGEISSRRSLASFAFSRPKCAEVALFFWVRAIYKAGKKIHTSRWFKRNPGGNPRGKWMQDRLVSVRSPGAPCTAHLRLDGRDFLQNCAHGWLAVKRGPLKPQLSTNMHVKIKIWNSRVDSWSSNRFVFDTIDVSRNVATKAGQRYPTLFFLFSNVLNLKTGRGSLWLELSRYNLISTKMFAKGRITKLNI